MAFLRYFLLFMCFPAVNVLADAFQVASPDKRVKLVIKNTASGLRYQLERDDKVIIAESPLGLAVDNHKLGSDELQFLAKTENSIRENAELLAGRSKLVADHYQYLKLEFASRAHPIKYLNVHARVYDRGVALRYELPKNNPFSEFNIQYELTGFFFPEDYQCFGLNLGKFSNGHEGEYDPVKASMMREHHLYDHPLVCKTGERQAVFALAESNVKDYPGSWYSGRGDGGLGVTAVLTPRFDNRPDGLHRVAVKGKLIENFLTPWRVVMLGEKPGDLTESSLVTLLGEPTKIVDTSWIRPGKVAWDWWNDNQVVLRNTSAEPGMNTETYKAYIDFAAALQLEYILIDAGWHEGSALSSTPGADVTKSIPAMNMSEIIGYAKERNVGVWVWLQWKQLDWQMEEALKAYQRWGIKGVKVDFMERSDQEMVDYYHKLLSMTAKYQIMVDLHGTFGANGMVRTYPHLLTQEGVMGAEFNKWSSRVTARHNVTVPYTRMILGPIDYTPGGFRHATREEFPRLRRNTLPYVQTTRGQALAMYVVYDSPLQMLADSPITYSKTSGIWPQPENEWQEGLEFIRDVPVTWDETRILQGDIGEFIVSARRKGDIWYLGAMTNEAGRQLKVELDFLGEGRYTADIWQDGQNISSIDKKRLSVLKDQSLKLSLAATGGAVVVLKKAE